MVFGTRDQRLLAATRRLVRQLDREFKSPAIAVSVIFVNDRYIQDLNRRYRRRDRPTDVLSFKLQPLVPNRQPSLPLGEVYVSRDTARQQARRYGVGYHDELQRLILHGVLHLLGLTHRQMEPFYRRFLGRD